MVRQRIHGANANHSSRTTPITTMAMIVAVRPVPESGAKAKPTPAAAQMTTNQNVAGTSVIQCGCRCSTTCSSSASSFSG